MQAGYCYSTFQNHRMTYANFNLKNDHYWNILGQDQEFWTMNVVKDTSRNDGSDLI
jgi:hypothetical protein